MKPSYDEQRKNAPATDRKFRENDEHLVARNKEDVALSPHGDKVQQHRDKIQQTERWNEASDEDVVPSSHR
jgi:hypothetical protein